ncbi:SurA N-terminal domain-containing protein [uncultured Sphingomonas sp.]|uniref:peptidylprolyl isomerase n=1 Tax=uncultured Sphingomonas sp. TaxID=158754 RepID=UPI0035CB14BD
MLQVFRRFTKSRAGVIVSFLVLGAIAFAFAAADVSDITPGGSVASGDIAEVGGEGVPVLELRQAAESQIEAARQRQPTFDAAQYLAAGGLDQAVERLVDGRALWAFGNREGVAVSKRSIDGQIASIPALLGPTGQFDQNLYQSLLRQRRLTDAQVRGDIARELMGQRLTAPQVGAAQVPAQLALPYASLLLERRAGQIGFVPVSAIGSGTAPSGMELNTFYTRNLSRYTVPERRAVRYAVVSPAQVASRAQPTDAEIAAAYAADRARYAPAERRTIAQVVVADQGGANALAANVRAGRSIADAARAAGLEATTQTATDRAAYASLAGDAAATAAFGAAQGTLIGPVRGPLGFVVARVDAVTRSAGRPLAEVRTEIVAALTQRKTAEALAEAQAAVDEALTGGSTFDEVVADRKLQAQATRSLLAGGIDPDAPGAQPDPALAPVLQAAFAVEQGDAPQIVPLGTDGGFALVALGQVTPAAPRPLAQIAPQVTRDLRADRARQAARRIALQVVARAGKGAPLAQALGSTGLRLPPPRPLDIARSQIAANPRGVEPALALLFAMAPGTAKLLESPGRDGWLVIKLDRVRPGDARGNRQLIDATRADLGRVVGREYAEQFVRAARNAVGVEIDRAAVGRVRAELQGQSR